jgi:hypothetical protein
LPAAGTLRDIGVIALRLGTVIPAGCLGLGGGCLGRGCLDDHWRRIRIGIRIDRCRIPVPAPIHDPPPAEAAVMVSMHPVLTALEVYIVLVKTLDMAVPSRVRQHRRGVQEPHNGEAQYDY